MVHEKQANCIFWSIYNRSELKKDYSEEGQNSNRVRIERLEDTWYMLENSITKDGWYDEECKKAELRMQMVENPTEENKLKATDENMRENLTSKKTQKLEERYTNKELRNFYQ